VPWLREVPRSASLPLHCDAFEMASIIFKSRRVRSPVVIVREGAHFSSYKGLGRSGSEMTPVLLHAWGRVMASGLWRIMRKTFLYIILQFVYDHLIMFP
jgi:hypothetical protein